MDNELERCRAWIEAALEYSGGTHDFSDIVEGLQKGVLQLWPAEKSCLVTEIIVFPKKRVLNVFLGGGELEEIMGMHESVIAWGKAQGCSALTMSGRAGWVKPLKEHGWARQHVSYVKEFD